MSPPSLFARHMCTLTHYICPTITFSLNLTGTGSVKIAFADSTSSSTARRRLLHIHGIPGLGHHHGGGGNIHINFPGFNGSFPIPSDYPIGLNFNFTKCQNKQKPKALEMKVRSLPLPPLYMDT